MMRSSTTAALIVLALAASLRGAAAAPSCAVSCVARMHACRAAHCPAAGMTTTSDGTVDVELPGPIAYHPPLK